MYQAFPSVFAYCKNWTVGRPGNKFRVWLVRLPLPDSLVLCSDPALSWRVLRHKPAEV